MRPAEVVVSRLQRYGIHILSPAQDVYKRQVRAGTHPQLLIDHPQIRIYIRLGSHRRTGISVPIRLGNQDGRRSALNALYIRLVDSLQRDCLEILPLTFLKQNIDQQSRLCLLYTSRCV